MTPREANEQFDDLINRGFITVLRIRRDGSRLIRRAPGADEWWEAAATYCMARDDGALTEAHRKRVCEAWLAIKDQVELNCAEQELVDGAMRFQ
jgi:hypothetical protein